MRKIIPFLWFDNQAEEAVNFYLSIFKTKKMGGVSLYGEEGAKASGRPKGTAMVVTFELEGQKFMALNGGPHFKFTPAISFFVVFDNEKEIETVWNKLVDGGSVLMPYNSYPWANKYGWLQDKYGLSWQLSWSEYHKLSQKITPFLMFTRDMAGKTKSAIKSYTSIFPNSKTEMVVPYTKDDGDKEGFIKHSRFTLAGQNFMAMDSSMSHDFSFNEAISFLVNCDAQKEMDYYWKKLTEEGKESQCGWLKDKYGISWQIIPTVLGEMMQDKDAEKSKRVMQAMLQMKKLDIEKLKQAYEHGAITKSH